MSTLRHPASDRLTRQPMTFPAATANALASDVGVDDIAAAAELLTEVVHRTPLIPGPPDLGGDGVFLKCENLQVTGSFKVRGAYVRLHGLAANQRRAGVVAASAGNHAQGVALAARLLEVPATVFMPSAASLPKVSATAAFGAKVRLIGRNVDDALHAASSFSAQRGIVFVHPFDHPAVIAGQGTVGLEILEQCPDVRTIVVGVGGGGLLAGVLTAVKSVRPDVRVVGVQAEGAASCRAALAAGHPVTLDSVSTLADGIAVGRVGDLPFDIIRRLSDGVLTVSETSLAEAMAWCLERAKLVVEPAGAAPVAAVRCDPGGFEARSSRCSQVEMSIHSCNCGC